MSTCVFSGILPFTPSEGIKLIPTLKCEATASKLTNPITWNLYGVFTVPDTETDKERVIKNCVEVFIQRHQHIYAIGLQTYFVGVCVGIGFGQCEHTIMP